MSRKLRVVTHCGCPLPPHQTSASTGRDLGITTGYGWPGLSVYVCVCVCVWDECTSDAVHGSTYSLLMNLVGFFGIPQGPGLVVFTI